MHDIDLVVFDLGGVLIDWDPRYLYRKIFDSNEETENFLSTICTSDWNLSLDAGRSFDDAIADRRSQFPEYVDAIEAYQHRWLEMISGVITPTVEIVTSLQQRRQPMVALTNWSAETFALIRHEPEYSFLDAFDRIFVSGELKMVKPDPIIFQHLLRSMQKEANRCLFIDDNETNVETARDLGFHTHQFIDAVRLEQALIAKGLLPSQHG